MKYSLTYRLKAAVLLLLFCITMLGNTLHVFTDGCVHVHIASSSNDEGNGSDTIATYTDEVANSSLQCYWGDFTIVKTSPPVFGGFLTSLLATTDCLSIPCNQLLSNLIHRATSLRGPPSLA